MGNKCHTVYVEVVYCFTESPKVQTGVLYFFISTLLSLFFDGVYSQYRITNSVRKDFDPYHLELEEWIPYRPRKRH